MAEPPRILPIFPLTGVVVLPLNWLPLHVFEPRYRALVEDALAGAGFIGMIQPLVPRDDNAPDPDAEPGDDPEVYPVGCAGRIERCERQPDGRFLLLLRGVSRFRVRAELAPRRGYRRVEADYEEFAADLAEAEAEVDPGPALAAARALGRVRGFDLDVDKLAGLPGFSLVNGLAAAMPLSPAEKQALLEAPDPAARQELLTSLLEMNAGPAAGGDGEGYTAPVVN
jgi:Lon protease-like protein